MKVIDLLNMISKGEEVPDEIKIGDDYYYRHIRADVVRIDFLYREKETTELWLDYGNIHLDDEVEIIEEKEMCHKCGKYPCEYNQTYCEFCLGISEEDKKIEKLDKYADVSGDLAYEWSFSEKKLKDKINEIIDYINEDKGE